MHLSATLELYYLASEMVGSSEYLCSAGGKFCNHFTEFLVCKRQRSPVTGPVWPRVFQEV